MNVGERINVAVKHGKRPSHSDVRELISNQFGKEVAERLTSKELNSLLDEVINAATKERNA